MDPLSRRALWKILNAVRYDRTIVFTTHVRVELSFINGRLNLRFLQFLDEADLLADNIAILAAPGKLVAQGSSVALKSSLGQGYTVEVRFHNTDDYRRLAQLPPKELLLAVRTVAPQAYVTKSSPFLAKYHLMSKDTTVVENVLRIFDQHADNYYVDSYDIRGASIEDIFLDLMNREVAISQDEETKLEGPLSEEPLKLSEGRKRTSMSQTLTCIPLVFLRNQQKASCVRTYEPLTLTPLSLPALSTEDEILISPPSTAAALGPLAGDLTIRSISDNQEFVSTIRQNYRNVPFGGISLNLSSGQSLIAWETTPPGTTAPALLNLVSNAVYNARLSATSPGTTWIIGANYASFPSSAGEGFGSFMWLIFFGGAMVCIATSVLKPH